MQIRPSGFRSQTFVKMNSSTITTSLSHTFWGYSKMQYFTKPAVPEHHKVQIPYLGYENAFNHGYGMNIKTEVLEFAKTLSYYSQESWMCHQGSPEDDHFDISFLVEKDAMTFIEFMGKYHV